MEAADRSIFAKAMDRLFSIYSAEITANMRDAWWGALSSYPLGHVLAGMDAHAKDPDNGRFRPTPAHVIAGVERAMGEHRRRLGQLRERFGAEIAALEERLYRAQHEKDLGRVDADWAIGEMQWCRNELSRIDNHIQAQATILRSRALGDVSNEDTSNAARALRLARQ